jgi:hypothetical protein
MLKLQKNIRLQDKHLLAQLKYMMLLRTAEDFLILMLVPLKRLMMLLAHLIKMDLLLVLMMLSVPRFNQAQMA